MAKKKKNLYPKQPKKTGIRAWLRRRKLRTRRSLAADIMLMIFLGAFGIFSLFPLIYTVVSAFKPMSEIFIFPPKLTVDNPTLDNFFDLSFILEGFDVPLSRYLFNTLVITGFGTLGTVFLGSLAAFALAKYEFPGSKVMSELIVSDESERCKPARSTLRILPRSGKMA